MDYFFLDRSQIATDTGEEPCVLTFVEKRLVAIVTHLASAENGDMRGMWFIEAAFGRCEPTPRDPFARLSEALKWIAKQRGIDVALLDFELSEIDRSFY